MRAMVYKSYGSSPELAELPRPKPTTGQVLVAVRSSSVNPVDWKVARGDMRIMTLFPFPRVPGLDVAGEVVEVGAGVKGFLVGQKVHARIGDLKGGACAEFALVGVDVLTGMPQGMDFATAAAIPLAGMTALQGLRDACAMPMSGATQRVLIVGASGGVGHLGVQIAVAAGAHVTGVCSGRNAELVRGLGAHAVIDYTQPDAFAGQAPFDIILDCVGGSHSPWLPRLQSDGHFASVVPGPAVIGRSLLNAFRGQKVHPVLLKTNAADLALLDGLFAAGKLRCVIDSHFSLDQLGQAWTRSISGRATGKIVIDVTA